MKAWASILLLVPIFSSCASPSKSDLDTEVRRLCAIDGGVKIYEVVKLSAEKYNKLLDNFGRLSIPHRDQAKSNDEYYVEYEVYYYKQGNPEISRRLYRITRRSDGKILGELVFYGRGGGDMPGPWHDSSLTCPTYEKTLNFESLIFLKEE